MIRRRRCLENFDVNQYLNDYEWTLYIDDLKYNFLDVINHFTTSRDIEPFRVSQIQFTETLVRDVLQLKKQVIYDGKRWIGSTFHHLKWLKTVTEHKVPIICHTFYRSRKVFLYLLDLHPTSVLESLDNVNSPFRYAIKYHYVWYLSMMIRRLLVPYEEIFAQNKRGDEARYMMYYPAYKAILNNSGFLAMVSEFVEDKQNFLIYILKILWKCEKIRQKKGMRLLAEHQNFYQGFFLNAKSPRVTAFLARRRLVTFEEDHAVVFVNHCIREGHTDALEMILNQIKEEGMTTTLEDVNYENTPLIYAITYNNYMSVKLLIDFGVDVNFTRESYESPLMYIIDLATKNPFIDRRIIRLLIDSGADINYQVKGGFALNYYDRRMYNALQVASNSGDEEIIEMLFRKTDVHDDNNIAFAMYQNTLRKKKDIEVGTEWWRRLKSIHVVDMVLLCASVVSQKEEEEEDESCVFANFIRESPVFDVCLKEICEMI